MKIRIILFAFVVVWLTGCATGGKGSSGLAVGMNNKARYNLSAAAQLAEAATSISKSLVQLKEIEQAASPPMQHPTPPPPSSYGMGDLASVDWSGPVEPILHQVAESSGYQVKVMGNAPPIPILITLYAHHQPLGDILRNIGLQCGKKAEVVVFPEIHTIELHYAEA